MMRITPAVLNLLIINIVIFLAPEILRLQEFFSDTFALHYIQGDLFKPWQFITYMFLHSSFRHLIGNMIGILVFGSLLEEVIGARRFYAFYLIVGLGAGILFMGTEYLEKRNVIQSVDTFLMEPTSDNFEILIVEEFGDYYQWAEPIISSYSENPQSQTERSNAIEVAYLLFNRTLNSRMVGASGALFGIILAAGLLFPFRRILLFFAIPIQIRLLAILYGAYEVYIQSIGGVDGIAHIAHIGGMLVGYLVLVYWGIARNRYQ